MFKKRFLEKDGQIWIELVIYTLVGLSIIAALLYFITPAIQEEQDKITIQQSERIMKTIQNRIGDVVDRGPGNTRVMEITIRKGGLTIDGESDLLIFELESKNMFSEPGQEIEEGAYSYITEEKNEDYLVTLKLNYTERHNITWRGEERKELFQKAARPYNIAVSNKGRENSPKDNRTVIEFR